MAIGINREQFRRNNTEPSFMATLRPHVFLTGTNTHFGCTLVAMCRSAGYLVHTVCSNASQVDMLYRLGCSSVVLGDPTDPPPESGFKNCAFAIHFTPAYINDADCQTSRFLARCATHVVKIVVITSCTVLLDHKATPIKNVSEAETLPENYPKSEQKQSIFQTSPSHTVRVLRNAEIVAAANAPKVIVVRPALLWGGDGDPFTANLVLCAVLGRLRLVNKGRFRTSTCHILNACAGAIAALRISREEPLPSYTFFLSDYNMSQHNTSHQDETQPRRYCDFVRSVLLKADIPSKLVDKALNRPLPLWLIRRTMQLTRWLVFFCCAFIFFFSSTSPLLDYFQSMNPSLCDAAVCRVGIEVTVRDDLARRVLGYRNVISIQEGIDMLQVWRPSRTAAEHKLWLGRR